MRVVRLTYLIFLHFLIISSLSLCFAEPIIIPKGSLQLSGSLDSKQSSFLQSEIYLSLDIFILDNITGVFEGRIESREDNSGLYMNQAYLVIGKSLEYKPITLSRNIYFKHDDEDFDAIVTKTIHESIPSNKPKNSRDPSNEESNPNKSVFLYKIVLADLIDNFLPANYQITLLSSTQLEWVDPNL